jgi:hypothetical protein
MLLLIMDAEASCSRLTRRLPHRTWCWTVRTSTLSASLNFTCVPSGEAVSALSILLSQQKLRRLLAMLMPFSAACLRFGIGNLPIA